MYFDAANPYHRRMMHYESDQQLSLPEIVGAGSVDSRTAAIIWQLLDRRASYIISGPTDPTPGVGKTTTLNALLPFYPSGTGLVYTMGMYEDFSFISDVTPTETTVLANEVSDHLRIYMWGRVARRFLKMPADGFSIATSCHADTLQDVLNLLTDDLKLQAPDIQGLQLIVNIGLTGRVYPRRRRWLTTHFIPPLLPNQDVPDHESPAAVRARITPLVISTWDRASDTFVPGPDATLAALAAWSGMPVADFANCVAERALVLEELAQQGADQQDTINAIEAFRQQHP